MCRGRPLALNLAEANIAPSLTTGKTRNMYKNVNFRFFQTVRESRRAGKKEEEQNAKK